MSSHLPCSLMLLYTEKLCLKSTQPGLTTSQSSHIIIRLTAQTEPLQPSFKSTDWEEFRKAILTRLEGLETQDDIPNEVILLSRIDILMCAITEMMDTCVLKCRSAPHQKCWWSQELTDRCSEVCRLVWRAYGRRLEPGDPIHTTHKEARRHYMTMIENTNKQHWEGFLASLDKKS